MANLINPLVKVQQSISNLFGQTISAELFVPAILEEIECRWFLQDIVLKFMPKKITECIAPQQAGLIYQSCGLHVLH